MGLFDNPLQTIGSVGGALVGGLPGAIAGNVLGNVFGQKGPQAPPPPATDPNLGALQQQRTQEASAFKANLPGYEQDASTSLANQSRRQLAGQMAQNNTSANRRGLLGSGINQAANAQASGNAATSYANANQQMNNQLQNQADQMESSAINNGYQYWQSAKAGQDAAYNAALANMMAARSGTSSLLGAASKLGGAAIGGS